MADGGTKHDDGKLRMGLVPPEVIEAIAEVMTHGAKKYDEHNWRKGMKWSRLYDAAQRHLNSFWKGDDIDSEWGLSHLAHALCCISFLYMHTREHKDKDDRFKAKVAPYVDPDPKDFIYVEKKPLCSHPMGRKCSEAWVNVSDPNTRCGKIGKCNFQAPKEKNQPGRRVVICKRSFPSGCPHSAFSDRDKTHICLDDVTCIHAYRVFVADVTNDPPNINCHA